MGLGKKMALVFTVLMYLNIVLADSGDEEEEPQNQYNFDPASVSDEELTNLENPGTFDFGLIQVSDKELANLEEPDEDNEKAGGAAAADEPSGLVPYKFDASTVSDEELATLFPEENLPNEDPVEKGLAGESPMEVEERERGTVNEDQDENSGKPCDPCGLIKLASCAGPCPPPPPKKEIEYDHWSGGGGGPSSNTGHVQITSHVIQKAKGANGGGDAGSSSNSRSKSSSWFMMQSRRKMDRFDEDGTSAHSVPAPLASPAQNSNNLGTTIGIGEISSVGAFGAVSNNMAHGVVDGDDPDLDLVVIACGAIIGVSVVLSIAMVARTPISWVSVAASRKKCMASADGGVCGTSIDSSETNFLLEEYSNLNPVWGHGNFGADTDGCGFQFQHAHCTKAKEMTGENYKYKLEMSDLEI